MADSTPILPQMAAAADEREVVFNGLLDSMSPPSLYGRNYASCTGLTWAYFGGRFASGSIASGTHTLTNTTTNYQVAARSNGAVSVSTSTTNWNDTTNYFRLYKMVTSGGVVTSYEDHREAYGWLNASSLVREIQIACSDLTTALTTGTTKAYFRAPRAMTIVGVRASLATAQASGSIFTVDINDSGTTILSTKLTIDNTEKTSTTAATAAVISDSAIADDAEVTVDIDQVGDGTAKGLIVTILYT
jgi:hypothetical protein